MNPRTKIAFAFGLIIVFAFLVWKPSITGKSVGTEAQRVVVVLKPGMNNEITGFIAADDEQVSVEELKVSTARAQREVLEDVNSPSILQRILFIEPEPEVEAERQMNIVPAMVVEATPDGIEELESHPLVEAVYPNIQFELVLSDSVPIVKADDLWNLSVNGSKINGSGVSVCVIDTGILHHPAFQDRIVDEKCYCSGNCCPNGQSTDDKADDTNSMKHGTHVSGIIAANGQVKGVAPGANIVAVKVCNTGCGLADIFAGIDYCLQVKDDYNIVAISGSIGDSGNYQTQAQCPTYFDSAVNAAYNAGITSVFASGNNGYQNGISYPGCSLNAIAVGATDKNNNIAGFSNLGPLLEVLAPGVSIQSTKGSTEYGSLSGTSQATPHVSGAIALLQQAAQNAGLSFSPDDIKKALVNTGVLSSYPIIDIPAAFDHLNIPVDRNNTPPVVVIASPTNGSVINSPVEFIGTVVDVEDGALANDSLVWTENGTVLGNGTSINVSLATGNHSVILTATDSAGLGATASVEFTVQDEPINNLPVVVINSPDEGAIVANPVILSGNATDDEDGLLVNNSLFWTENGTVLGNGTTVVMNMTEGNHTVMLTAFDSGGLNASSVVNFVVDTNQSPVVVIENPENGAIITNSVMLNGSANDYEDGILTNESLVWKENGTVLGTGKVIEINFSQGTHIVELIATDSDNKSSSAKVNFTVIEENSPPEVTILFPIDNSTVINPVELVGNATDEEDGTLPLLWKENGSLINNSPIYFSPGEHTITLEATDSVNVTMSDSVTFRAQTCHLGLDGNDNAVVDIGDFVLLLRDFTSESMSCNEETEHVCKVEFDKNGNGLVDIGDFVLMLGSFALDDIVDVNGNSC